MPWLRARVAELEADNEVMAQLAARDAQLEAVQARLACGSCGADLADAPVIAVKMRQVFEAAPPPRPRVIEYQVVATHRHPARLNSYRRIIQSLASGIIQRLYRKNMKRARSLPEDLYLNIDLLPVAWMRAGRFYLQYRECLLCRRMDRGIG